MYVYTAHVHTCIVPIPSPPTQPPPATTPSPPAGFALVKFENADVAGMAIAGLNGFQVDGRPIQVRFDRQADGPGGMGGGGMGGMGGHMMDGAMGGGEPGA